MNASNYLHMSNLLFPSWTDFHGLLEFTYCLCSRCSVGKIITEDDKWSKLYPNCGYKTKKKSCLLRVWWFEVFLRLESSEANPINIMVFASFRTHVTSFLNIPQPTASTGKCNLSWRSENPAQSPSRKELCELKFNELTAGKGFWIYYKPRLT